MAVSQYPPTRNGERRKNQHEYDRLRALAAALPEEPVKRKKAKPRRPTIVDQLRAKLAAIRGGAKPRNKWSANAGNRRTNAFVNGSEEQRQRALKRLEDESNG